MTLACVKNNKEVGMAGARREVAVEKIRDWMT